VRRPRLEVADVFHRHGADWRRANAGHVSLGQLQVMSAIEQCRSAALGGHVERCEDCGHSRIAYNSCRNRHCPKCHGAAAMDWLAAREADLLPVSYFHVVFTLPGSWMPEQEQWLHGLCRRSNRYRRPSGQTPHRLRPKLPQVLPDAAQMREAPAL